MEKQGIQSLLTAAKGLFLKPASPPSMSPFLQMPLPKEHIFNPRHLRPLCTPREAQEEEAGLLYTGSVRSKKSPSWGSGQRRTGLKQCLEQWWDWEGHKLVKDPRGRRDLFGISTKESVEGWWRWAGTSGPEHSDAVQRRAADVSLWMRPRHSQKTGLSPGERAPCGTGFSPLRECSRNPPVSVYRLLVV